MSMTSRPARSSRGSNRAGDDPTTWYGETSATGRASTCGRSRGRSRGRSGAGGCARRASTCAPPSRPPDLARWTVCAPTPALDEVHPLIEQAVPREVGTHLVERDSQLVDLCQSAPASAGWCGSGRPANESATHTSRFSTP